MMAKEEWVKVKVQAEAKKGTSILMHFQWS